MNDETKGLFQVHLGIFLTAFIALFAKLIPLSPTLITLGRVFFASVVLFAILKFKKQKFSLENSKDLFYLVLLGVIFAIHMVTFFYSAQLSTIAISLVTVYLYPIFVAILEPYLFKEKIKLKNVALALVALLGVMLIVPEFKLENNIAKGVAFGLVSAFSLAVILVSNKKYIKKYPSELLTFYQFGISTVVLLPFLLIENFKVTNQDIILLFLVGAVFTVGGYNLRIIGMKYINAYRASIIGTIEPVYGTILAAIILGEVPEIRTIVGGAIILATCLYATIQKQKSDN
ncbi:MAG: DMT family transporter [Candidatus Micrarchaeota archaeon]|nr:DMT family transporter [Candidatus Micrarchaeota archaeon]